MPPRSSRSPPPTRRSRPRWASWPPTALALGGTFSLRRRLGTQRWRRAHRAIPCFWALALGQALLTGTDTFAWWFPASAAAPVMAGVTLLAVRRLGPHLDEWPATPAAAKASREVPRKAAAPTARLS